MQIKSVSFIKSSPNVGQCPESKFPEYAFVGRSNVGKSSLINSLTNKKKLALISGSPGKTRLINHFLVNDGWYLVDLPGYGYAKVPEQIRAGWRKLVEDYISERQNVRVVFVLIDARNEPTYLDELMISWLEYYEIPYCVVLTKADKISKNKMDKQIYRVAKIVKLDNLCIDYIPFSIISGEGKLEVLGIIEEYLNKPPKED